MQTIYRSTYNSHLLVITIFIPSADDGQIIKSDDKKSILFCQFYRW